ncbi:hypothetical protein HMPREF9080_02598 [Cardiobacterium valvarum F0432]|uniref:Uncharacterized protein n=1 Tax=Cardiobacterium valvarum F0432 TaxID=797473 RepID=G9ZIH5_9GAMM|nr:hypothetical protein HMPREF9080_02598 [Cardiobacterium valvarum F0432]
MLSLLAIAKFNFADRLIRGQSYWLFCARATILLQETNKAFFVVILQLLFCLLD